MIARIRSVNPFGALGGLVWLAIVIIPLYWVVITSLRSQAGFFGSSQLALPRPLTFSNFHLVLSNQFGTYLLNSVIVTAAAVVIILAVALMAGYGIVRSRHKVTWTAFNVFLLGLAIPLQATIIPVYYVITKLHLYDTLLAVILPSAAFAIPVSVLILVNFLRDVPGELY